MSGFCKARLGRMHDALAAHVARGDVPGIVALVSRGGEVHVDALGAASLAGAPLRRDAIFRIASMTKPISAAAAMILVEECVLRLDDPVDRWLPELADRRVLRRLDGALDDTVPAKRPIRVRDLLTLRMGFGYLLESPGGWPILTAANAAGVLIGPPKPQAPPAPDDWIARVGGLPLMFQPGERWLYDLGLDVLGVLIARAAQQPLPAFLHERIFAPLGMKDTGFSVPPEKLARFTSCYARDPGSGALAAYDDARDSQWSRAPAFPAAASGLVSTADDCLAFWQMLLDKGRHGSERILSRPSVELMTSDQLTAEQRASAGMILSANLGWGFGMGVVTRRDEPWATPGRFGWDGGLGTSAHADPVESLVGILLTTRTMDSPEPPKVFSDFWTSAYQALDD